MSAEFDSPEVREAVTKLRLFLNTESGKISSMINEALTNKYATKADIRKINTYIKKAKNSFDRMLAGFSVAIRKIVNESWSAGIDDVVTALAKIPTKGMYNSQTVPLMIRHAIADFSEALTSAQKNFNRFIRRTQQTLISEAEVTTAIARGLGVEGTTEAAKKLLVKEFGKISHGNVININGRKYQVDKYAEMVARTRAREANSQAVVKSAADFGQDLVQVSSHNTTSKICQEYEGRIFSISGRSDKYPKLEATAPFHPNCLHVITVYIERAA